MPTEKTPSPLALTSPSGFRLHLHETNSISEWLKRQSETVKNGANVAFLLNKTVFSKMERRQGAGTEVLLRANVVLDLHGSDGQMPAVDTTLCVDT